MFTNSVLEKEIHEQPAVIRRLLDKEWDNIARITDALRGRFNRIIIAARGTSDNAARYAKYLFGAHNQLQVALATPSLFTMYHLPPRMDGALIVGISQSGQSPDIVSVITEGRRQGEPTLAITNDAQSPLAVKAEYVISLHAGKEEAVAATKTYTASLAALALLSSLLVEDTPRADTSKHPLDELRALPDQISKTLEGVAPLLTRVERYRFMEHCAVIGRGYNYATAFEIALKVKELTRIVAEPYSSADFRHGPIAMINEGFPVISIAPQGDVTPDVRRLIQELKPLNAEQLIISDDAALLEQANLAFTLPGEVSEWLTPLVAVIPGQLFGMALAHIKGLDPDQPVGLSKVTETV